MRIPLFLLFSLLFFVQTTPLKAEHVQRAVITSVESADYPSHANAKRQKKVQRRSRPLAQAATQDAGGILTVILAAGLTLPLFLSMIAAGFGISAIGFVGLLFGTLLVGLLYWAGIVRLKRKGTVSRAQRLRDTSVIFGSISSASFFSILILALAFDWAAVVLLGVIGITALLIWVKYALKPMADMKKEQ